jgi:hypothetical protein
LLYSLGACPTENAAPNNPFTSVMGGCVAIAQIFLMSVTISRIFPSYVQHFYIKLDVFTGHYQATHISSHERCIAIVPHVTLFYFLTARNQVSGLFFTVYIQLWSISLNVKSETI